MRREKCFKEIGFEKDTVLSYFNKHNMAMKMHMLLTSNPFCFFHPFYGQSEPAPHQCINTDGWCTDGIRFFIPVLTKLVSTGWLSFPYATLIPLFFGWGLNSPLPHPHHYLPISNIIIFFENFPPSPT